MGLHVILVGDVLRGFTVIGPFKSYDAAEEWAYSPDGLRGDDWVIAPLKAARS